MYLAPSRHETGISLVEESSTTPDKYTSAELTGPLLDGQGRIVQGLRAVVAAADELAVCPDLPTLLRRAVELGRDRLGMERCAIFLLDDDDEHVVGTFGTDLKGQTTDERSTRLALDEIWMRRFHPLQRHPAGWDLDENWEVSNWVDGRPVNTGRKSWLASTLIQAARGPIGVLVNDAAITGAPVDPVRQELAVVFSSFLGNLIDRKRTEEELRDITTHARCILWHADVIGQPGWEEETDERIHRFTWRIRVADEAAAQQILALDVSPNLGYAFSFTESCHPEDRIRIFAAAAHAMRSGRSSYSYEFRAYDCGGHEHWLSADVSLRSIGPGRWRAVGVCTDITERKRAEEDLNAIMAGARGILWQEVVEYRDGEVVCDFEIVHEEGAQRLFPLEVSQGETYTDAWLESRLLEDRETSDRNWNRALVSGATSYTQEFRCRGADDNVRWFSEAVQIQSLGPEKWRLFGVCMDITELKQAQDDLRYVVSHAGCILWNATVTANREDLNDMNWEIRVFDEDAAQRFLPMKTTPDQPYTDAWYLSRSPEQNAEMGRVAADALGSGKRVYVQEFQCQPVDGSPRWIREHVHVEPTGVGTWRLVGVCMDISDLKEAECRIEALNSALERRVQERTQLLEAANHELESFAYAVAHDLRGPLRSIDGYALAVMEDYGAVLNDQALGYLQRIRTGGQHMGKVMDALLGLSRVTRTEIQFERVDLSAMAESIVRELRERSPERKVEVQIQQGMTVRAAPDLLKIALTNLIGNAWKFTGMKDPARIEFDLTEDTEGPTYCIRDNGAGFDMQYGHKLFGPFQRLHDPKEFEGTGIGLATVQRVILRHGGRVWAEGIPGEGAAFFFKLST